MVGFANIIAREMMDHLFITYGNITAVDLETIFNKCAAHGTISNLSSPFSNRLKIVLIIMKQEASSLVTHSRSIWVMQKKATGHFMGACRRWNEKPSVEKTWAQFTTHFAATHRQHKQMQGESAATSGYHAANATLGQTEEQMNDTTIGDLANLTTATAADRGVVATLTEANARLTKQLEDNSNELQELKILLKKERTERRGQRSLTHGYKVANTHTILSCNFPKQGHKREATRAENMVGSPANKE
jgi:hypothetical protein